MLILVHLKYNVCIEKLKKESDLQFTILIPHCSRITQVSSADEFYTTMGTLTQEMLDNDIVNADDLIKVLL